MIGYSNEKHHPLIHSKTTLVLYTLEKESEIADTMVGIVMKMIFVFSLFVYFPGGKKGSEFRFQASLGFKSKQFRLAIARHDSPTTHF